MRKLVAAMAGLLVAVLLIFNGPLSNYRTKANGPKPSIELARGRPATCDHDRTPRGSLIQTPMPEATPPTHQQITLGEMRASGVRGLYRTFGGFLKET
jgi:hypothetical protein